MKTVLTLTMLALCWLAASPAAAYDTPWLPTEMEEGDADGDGKSEYRVSTYYRGKTRLLSIVDTYWPEDGTPRGRVQYLFYKGRLAYAEVTNYSSSSGSHPTLVHFFAESGAGVSMDDKQGDGRVDALALNDEKGQLWAVFARESDGRLTPLGSMTEAKMEDISTLPVFIQDMLDE